MPAAVGGRGHVEYAFCVYILDRRRSKPRSYSSQSLTHPALKKLQNKTAAIGHCQSYLAGKLEPAHADGRHTNFDSPHFSCL